MEAICGNGDSTCEVYALAAVLHSLHLYCATISAALICCCAPSSQEWLGRRWRGQNVRGISSLIVGTIWCCGAASATLRSGETVRLVSALMAPLGWFAAAVLHVALWTRHNAAPVLYLAVYWFLSAASSAAIMYQHIKNGASTDHVDVYIQLISTLFSTFVAVVDCICFYDEVTKRLQKQQKLSSNSQNISYKHNITHFYSKITFYWINTLLYKGYESRLEQNDLGELPENERSIVYYKRFKAIYEEEKNTSISKERSPSIFRCYIRMVWPNFYISGVLKLLSDLISVVPPLGLSVVIAFVETQPTSTHATNSHVTVQEFFSNGYVMLFIVTLVLIFQAILSQNSTHLVTVEGTRLKTALQGIMYDKCMRLAPWSSSVADNDDEDSPLLVSSDVNINSRTGLLTNLMSQDTYNIMSCVWICHYLWAIPIKVIVILFLLYTKLGLSAILGSTASIFFITPLQFYIGKKISDNSKHISKCTDHRISKMSEILRGINMIKLYVWEDLFNEKILNLREVELQLLNKDSMYWSFLTFTTQASTVLVTVITFISYYFLGNSEDLKAVNVFAALALFNQLSVPLLILPVTILMVIQATVSTNRIKDFLELPESNNLEEEELWKTNKSDKFNDAFHEAPPTDVSTTENEVLNKDEADDESTDHFSDTEMSDFTQEYLVRFRNAAFSWGDKDETFLEIDDFDIPAGKLVMVVGTSASGKSSLLSAILGEICLLRGDVSWNGVRSTWYEGQPPWLLEGTVRENILMGNTWSQEKYARVVRATGLRPDLQILPDGDATHLGSHGSPLSGGQRVRVCVARALYSNARLLALDEPLAALDATLARHVVARAFVPAVRSGRTIIIATNRLELLHYADLVIAMEDGRISGFGRCRGDGVLGHWATLAAEARATAARSGVGPPGGTMRERSQLSRALTRAKLQHTSLDDTLIGISEATGVHLLAEVPTRGAGSWRRTTMRIRPTLSRQLSTPPLRFQNSKWQRDLRRAVSADASNTTLRREASLLRRFLHPRTHRTLARWTPRTIRRLISSESEGSLEGNQNNVQGEESMLEATCISLTSNGVETTVNVNKDDSPSEPTENISERSVWWSYGRACGWWCAVFWAAASTAQALALAADCWLAYITTQNANAPLNNEQMWNSVRLYAAWSVCGVCAAGVAQAASARGGAAARRVLHERLLHAVLHAPLHHHRITPIGLALHRFSSDVHVIDKKMPIAVSRWAQLGLLCVAATLVNVVVSPWTSLAIIPAVAFYFILQTVYLKNARGLQTVEARSAATVVSLSAETCAGGGVVRAGRLQRRMRAAFCARLDDNHNALLVLNATNRWLGLTMDLVGAACVCACVCAVVCGAGARGDRGAAAGLAGAYALLLPAYLAHLAKCRADLDLHLAALERIVDDANTPQEDYREYCQVPAEWERTGRIDFENVDVQHEPGSPVILKNINLSISPAQKIAICGRSGSGKSTLLLSCVGATTVCEGRIAIDGFDARQVPLRALRHRLVLLPQEPVLFSGTLRENLDPLAVHTDDEIWRCLKAVGLQDFVTAQPAGLECCVGRAKCAWRGGRAARACAARAALHARNACALLLDEPAAALDASAERALLAAFVNIAPNTTIITVAHRVSSIRGFEYGVVMESGRVVEQGAVTALLARPASRLSRLNHN